jgi:hypothetical protein
MTAMASIILVYNLVGKGHPKTKHDQYAESVKVSQALRSWLPCEIGDNTSELSSWNYQNWNPLEESYLICQIRVIEAFFYLIALQSAALRQVN